MARRVGRSEHSELGHCSTCTIDGRAGLLLVEAKAHHAELKEDGKTTAATQSVHSTDNHKQIATALSQASAQLNQTIEGWNLNCDSHYQLANRFTWAWKLASMDIPVVLVYLGFLRATEMNDLSAPFIDCEDWTSSILKHSRNIVRPRMGRGHQGRSQHNDAADSCRSAGHAPIVPT